MIHLDSSLLIDLAREAARERPGPAFAALEGLDGAEILGVSVHVLCELRTGAELSRQPLREHEELDRLCSGLPVATMDLLIATTAVLDDATLLTRNVKDFSRVPGLRVQTY
jgi:tRNA(fMet)-specific endonuclease VapC